MRFRLFVRSRGAFPTIALPLRPLLSFQCAGCSLPSRHLLLGYRWGLRVFHFHICMQPSLLFPSLLRAPELILLVSAGQTSASTCQPCSSSQSCPEGTSNPTAVAVSSDTTSQIVAYVLSAVGALIFILVAVFVIRARVAKLRAAGIQPTLKRVVFLQKTLSKYRPLLEPNERNGSLQVVAQVMTPDARTARLVAEANAKGAK
jgi:hypothetical protein